MKRKGIQLLTRWALVSFVSLFAVSIHALEFSDIAQEGEIRFLKQRGIGVLITDHNVRETLGICDHAFIISEGRVLAQGTPQEIITNADVRRVYLGEHFKM